MLIANLARCLIKEKPLERKQRPDHVFADSLCLALGLSPDLAVDVETCDSLDTQNQVIVLGTFSKLLCPGLRLAWTMAPAEWVDRITKENECQQSISQSY